MSSGAFTFNGQDISGSSIGRRRGAKARGVTYYDETLDRMFVTNDDIAPGFLVPLDDKPVFNTASPRHVFDHFRGTLSTVAWDAVVGSDPQCVSAALETGVLFADNITMTAGDAGTGMAADGAVIASKSLSIEPEEGEVEIVCKFKIDAITDVWFYLGLTDVLPSTTLEAPVTLSVVTFTTNATDACGIMFDTAATTDTIRAVGVKNNVDATHADLGIAPVADTYLTVRLKVSTAGVLTPIIDGVIYDELSAATSVGVDQCVIAAICSRTTATRKMTIDYLGYA